jgi:hypothetical protein
MAITATYVTPAFQVKNAYIRIKRIWGSKEEGWNAWVAVFEKEGDTQHRDMFSINVPYVEDENPFKALYAAVENLSFVVTKEPEVIDVPIMSEPVFSDVVEQVVEEKVEEKKATKGRKKK